MSASLDCEAGTTPTAMVGVILHSVAGDVEQNPGLLMRICPCLWIRNTGLVEMVMGGDFMS